MRTPSMVSTPTMLRQKVYIHVLLMRQAKGFRYIIASCDDLSLASEGHALRTNTIQDAATFTWEQICCGFGAIGQVVTEDESEFIGKTFNLLMDVTLFSVSLFLLTTRKLMARSTRYTL